MKLTKYTERELCLIKSKAFSEFRRLFYLKYFIMLPIECISLCALLFVAIFSFSFTFTKVWGAVQIFRLIICILMYTLSGFALIKAIVNSISALKKGPDYNATKAIKENNLINITTLINDMENSQRLSCKLYLGNEYIFFIPSWHNKLDYKYMYMFIRRDEISSLKKEINRTAKFKYCCYAITCKNNNTYNVDVTTKIMEFMDKYDIRKDV